MTFLPELGRTDIYLIDQIMKGRYQSDHVILDAGCGRGRNMEWLLRNGFDITAVDESAEAIAATSELALSLERPDVAEKLTCCAVERMPFDDGTFDHVISSAVLHFARNHDHFKAMMAEMIRVLKPGGSLWIRMASDVGIESLVSPDENGVAYLPDGSDRYLLTKPRLQWLLNSHPVELLEPFKNVNVSDQRVMCVLLLRKKLHAIA